MTDGEVVRWRRIFAVLIAALLLVEAGCHVVLWKWAGKPYESLSPYVWSPYGLVRNNPRLTSPAFHISLDGFRDFGDYSPQKPFNTLRIFLLGGSTLYSGLGGVGLPDKPRVGSGETIAQFLRREMEADPALEGIDIEVLNGGVNYNRIVEVSAAYLGEFMYWQPDFVIICSSANDFIGAPRDEQSGSSQLFHAHPWEAEFERQVNGHNFFAFLERMFRGGQESSAALALLMKVESKLVDTIVARFSSFAAVLSPHRLPTKASEMKQAPKEQALNVKRWISEYLAHIGAIGAAAIAQEHQAVFVWEYFLAHLKDRKPFSEEEEFLFKANKFSSYVADAKFRDEVRDMVAAFSSAHGILFVDPLPYLRHHKETVFIDHVHYTVEGNKFMARLIYQSIKKAVHQRTREIRNSRFDR